MICHVTDCTPADRCTAAGLETGVRYHGAAEEACRAAMVAVEAGNWSIEYWPPLTQHQLPSREAHSCLQRLARGPRDHRVDFALERRQKVGHVAHGGGDAAHGGGHVAHTGCAWAAGGQFDRAR